MTPRQLETMMKKHEWRQIDLSRLLHKSTRQIRRWQDVGMPLAESTLLRLIDVGYVSYDDVWRAGGGR